MDIYDTLPHSFNVASFFIEEALKRGWQDKPAYVQQERLLTYRQLDNFVRRMAALLQNKGIEWENRVAILLPDSLELVVTFWGSIWEGAVPVPINVAYRLTDIAYILEDCRAKILITTQEWHEKLSHYKLPFLQHTIIVDGNPALLPALEDVQTSEVAATTCKDDSAFWLYTSGSTGKPKGVIHLHHDMVICVELYARNTIGLKENDIIYSVAKIPFAYGHGNLLYFPLAVGATAILSDSANAFDIIGDIERYRPSIFFGIPSIYAAILKIQELSPLNAMSLRLCLSAAESLPPSVWYTWKERFGLEICEGIGTTELLHIFLSNYPGRCKPGSTGQIVAGYEVRITNERGETVGPLEVGDLEVRGESLMLGYWNRHKETTQAIFGDAMRTGDKYMYDEEGYFYFAGRADDRFKVNGQWVLPLEVEDVLLQHPDVQDAAVVAATRENEMPVVQVVAYVVLKDNVDATSRLEQALLKHGKRMLPHFKAPQRVVFVENIQRTATGKIDRKHLRDLESAME